MNAIRSFIFMILISLGTLSFSQEAGYTNRSMLMMEPEEFFNHEIANQQIPLYQPDNNLLSVSIFHATNIVRKKFNLPTLKPDYTLHMAGVDHIKSMRRNRFFAHDDPYDSSQRTIRKRIEKNGGDFSIVAENIALVHPFRTQDDQYKFRQISHNRFDYFDMNDQPLQVMTYGELGKSLLTDWYNSDGHRQNLLDKKLTHLGIAVVVTENVNKQSRLPDVYAVQDFGSK